MVPAVAVKNWTHVAASAEGRGVCGNFAIGPYYWAVEDPSTRCRESGRSTMTRTGHHGIRDKATASHSATPRLCNVTSDGANGVGHAASKQAYRHIADAKEGRGLEDRDGVVA